jgi:hypothetical protein
LDPSPLLRRAFELSQGRQGERIRRSELCCRRIGPSGQRVG